MALYQIGFVLAIGIIIGYTFSRFKGKVSTSPTSSMTASEPESMDNTARLYELAAKTHDFFERTAHPKDLLDSETFKQGVAMLSSQRYTDVQLIEYYAGGNVLIGCMALEALRNRPLSEAVVNQLIFHIGSRYIWSLFFAFRVLEGETPLPVVSAVLVKAPDWWKDEELLVQILRDFIDHRLKKGEQVTLRAQPDEISKQQLNRVQNLIKVLGRSGLDPLHIEIQEKLQTLVNDKFLNSVGRLWEPMQPGHFLHKNEDMENILNRMGVRLRATKGDPSF